MDEISKHPQEHFSELAVWPLKAVQEGQYVFDQRHHLLMSLVRYDRRYRFLMKDLVGKLNGENTFRINAGYDPDRQILSVNGIFIALCSLRYLSRKMDYKSAATLLDEFGEWCAVKIKE